MKILGIAGSLRQESWNRKLLRLAEGVLEARGVEVEEFDLAPLPMYNADVQAKGYPEPVAALRGAIEGAGAILIASPEYNNTIPGVLKNAIDWASRAPNVLNDKVFFVMGTGPGRSGAVRMHMHLAYSLASNGAWVVPQPRVLLPNTESFMTPEGTLTDDSVADLLEQAMTKFLDTAKRLSGPG